MTDHTPGTDLVYSTASLSERKDYARALAAAGSLLPRGLMEKNDRGQDVPSPGKVLLIAETGNMLGIHPVAALQGINVIEGKPTLAPALMSALVRRAGHKLRVTTKGTIEGGDFAATATLIRADDPDHPYTATWTPQRGARAGLCKYERDPKTGYWTVTARSEKGKRLPWETYTEALCKARAIGEVSRDGAEDALLGVHYTPEELGAEVGAEGEVIQEAVVVEPARPTRFDPNPWEDRLATAETVDDLRHLWTDARQARVLDEPLSNGEPMRDVILRTQKRMEQNQAAEAAQEPAPEEPGAEQAAYDESELV